MSVQLMRGVFLLAAAAVFAFHAIQLKIGTPAKPGPGLFPLIVSCALGLVALAMMSERRLQDTAPNRFVLKSIGLITVGMVGFAVLAHWSVIPAIVFLVFTSSLAGSDFSVVRCLKISAVLIAIAAAFRFGLGVNLRWW